MTGDRVRQTEALKEKCDSKNIESDVRVKDYIKCKTKMVEYAERRSTEARRSLSSKFSQLTQFSKETQVRFASYACFYNTKHSVESDARFRKNAALQSHVDFRLTRSPIGRL